MKSRGSTRSTILTAVLEVTLASDPTMDTSLMVMGVDPLDPNGAMWNQWNTNWAAATLFATALPNAQITSPNQNVLNLSYAGNQARTEPTPGVDRAASVAMHQQEARRRDALAD